jgi:hypothetical protein
MGILRRYFVCTRSAKLIEEADEAIPDRIWIVIGILKFCRDVLERKRSENFDGYIYKRNDDGKQNQRTVAFQVAE